MSTSDVFGEIRSGLVAEEGVRDILHKWMPHYLGEAGRQAGMDQDDLPDIKSFGQSSTELEKWPEQALPNITVISTGLADSPSVTGRGMFTATWIVGVGVITSGRNEKMSNRLAKIYGATVRAVLLQKPGLELDDESRVTRWRDERYDDLVFDDKRSLSAALLFFDVEVVDVVDSSQGPLVVPDPDPRVPPGDWPTVDEVILTIDKEPIV